MRFSHLGESTVIQFPSQKRVRPTLAEPKAEPAEDPQNGVAWIRLRTKFGNRVIEIMWGNGLLLVPVLIAHRIMRLGEGESLTFKDHQAERSRSVAVVRAPDRLEFRLEGSNRIYRVSAQIFSEIAADLLR